MENLANEIGGHLREARGLAGLSVDDVVFRTRIPGTVIVALEEGNFAAFSSPTYAKSFLKQYSDFLNVNACVWIDSLEPAPFVAGEIARPLWDTASPKKEEKAPEPGSSNGWLSALSVMAFSFGMVYVAMKGYDFFEARFGGEVISSGTKKELVEKAARPTSPEIPSKLATGSPPPKKTDDEISQPPPRAIIVR